MLDELLELLMLLDRRVRVVACVAAEVVMGASSGDASLRSADPLVAEVDREDSDIGYESEVCGASTRKAIGADVEDIFFKLTETLRSCRTL